MDWQSRPGEAAATVSQYNRWPVALYQHPRTGVPHVQAHITRRKIIHLMTLSPYGFVIECCIARQIAVVSSTPAPPSSHALDARLLHAPVRARWPNQALSRGCCPSRQMSRLTEPCPGPVAGDVQVIAHGSEDNNLGNFLPVALARAAQYAGCCWMGGFGGVASDFLARNVGNSRWWKWWYWPCAEVQGL